MSLNSLSQAMPAIQSALPSRFDTRPSTSTAAGPNAPVGRSISGSSSSSLRAAAAARMQQQQQQQLQMQMQLQQQMIGAPGSVSLAPPVGAAHASDFASSPTGASGRQHHRATIFANPPTVFVMGVPLTIFATTCISLGLNLISIILLATSDCSFGLYQVRHMFGFLLLAQVSLGAMLLFNIYHHHYHYNCLSLSLSFMFSGSAALLIFGLFETLVSGLCAPKGTPSGSVMASKYPANYAIWLLTSLSVTSQLVAHYYYG